MTDIIDAIDALVDDQMAGGEPIGGYDYNDPNYPQCPHCGDDWHGLKITRRMRDMRWDGIFDENYRYADDDSEVLCPGSDFIGPWARVWQVEMMRTEKYGTSRLASNGETPSCRRDAPGRTDRRGSGGTAEAATAPNAAASTGQSRLEGGHWVARTASSPPDSPTTCPPTSIPLSAPSCPKRPGCHAGLQLTRRLRPKHSSAPHEGGTGDRVSTQVAHVRLILDWVNLATNLPTPARRGAAGRAATDPRVRASRRMGVRHLSSHRGHPPRMARCTR
ncbi:hypothetical protein GS416_03885 [Rhodococcus hoagii]|nr:hypothetical protein [Prescottella equi]